MGIWTKIKEFFKPKIIIKVVKDDQMYSKEDLKKIFNKASSKYSSVIDKEKLSKELNMKI